MFIIAEEVKYFNPRRHLQKIFRLASAQLFNLSLYCFIQIQIISHDFKDTMYL